MLGGAASGIWFAPIPDMRLGFVFIILSLVASAEEASFSSSSGFSLGPDGVSIGNAGGSIQVQSGPSPGGGIQFSTSGSLLDGAGQNGAPPVSIIPAPLPSPSALTDSNEFFQSVGEPTPQPASSRRPVAE